MFLPKRKLIALLFLFFLVLSVFVLSTRQITYKFRASVMDVVSLPLFLLDRLTQECKALVFFHRNYWLNLKLQTQNGLLLQEKFLTQELEAENARLRALLDLRARQEFKTIVADVIGRDFNAFRPAIVLNKGKKDGVKQYAAVLTQMGLVGKVLEAGQLASKVILINDPDLSVPAINARTREHGLVSGSLGGRCVLRFLDLDSDVKVGDSIITSGLNGTYPEGLSVATVKIVSTESSGLAKFAVLEPSVALSSLEEVMVVLPKD